MSKDLTSLDFDKVNGLIPAVIQDNDTLEVLMLGFMNKEALNLTLATKKITFFSRSKNRIWVKGETSGNYLYLKDIYSDCDNDTLLIKVLPVGNTCHLNQYSCFSTPKPALSYIGSLNKIIDERISNPTDTSYTNQLIKKGLPRLTQKLGEEAVETVIAALSLSLEELHGEMTDLLYHYLVLLKAKGSSLEDIAKVIKQRLPQNKIQN